MILEGREKRLLCEMTADAQWTSAALQFEKAPKIRDDIVALQNLELRGDVDKDVQAEIFHCDPKHGLIGLKEALGL